MFNDCRSVSIGAIKKDTGHVYVIMLFVTGELFSEHIVLAVYTASEFDINDYIYRYIPIYSISVSVLTFHQRWPYEFDLYAIKKDDSE